MAKAKKQPAGKEKSAATATQPLSGGKSKPAGKEKPAATATQPLAGDKSKPARKEKPKETNAELIASLASVLVIGVFIITFCLQAFEIPSSSMVKTLLIGDHVFVDRVRLAPPRRWRAG